MKLSDVRVVVFGAGSAGMGIADQIRDAIAHDSKKSPEEAAEQIWALDKPGLLTTDMQLMSAQKMYAMSDWNGERDLLSVIKQVKPHVLIGTSTKPGAFTEEICREMAAHVDRPMILPLSNPTRLHEAVPADIIRWTDAKALVATGSPFDPVHYNGKVYEIAENNNSTVFPGIGLGAVLCRTKQMTTSLLVAAVRALAATSPALQDPQKPLLPDVTDVRKVSVEIAAGVITQAVKEGLAQAENIPVDDQEELKEWIRAQMWEPKYRELERVDKQQASRMALGQVGNTGVRA